MAGAHKSHVPEKGVANGLATLDSSSLVPVSQLPESARTFLFTCGRNSSAATNIWLRDGNGIPLNLAPYRVPFDCRIVAISATGAAAQTWDAEVYGGTDTRAGGTPTDGNKLAELQLSSSSGSQITGLSVGLSAGDELGIFCRGTSIQYPRVIIWLVRTA